jgi:hypothetical protein
VSALQAEGNTRQARVVGNTLIAVGSAALLGALLSRALELELRFIDSWSMFSLSVLMCLAGYWQRLEAKKFI